MSVKSIALDRDKQVIRTDLTRIDRHSRDALLQQVGVALESYIDLGGFDNFSKCPIHRYPAIGIRFSIRFARFEWQ